MSVSDSLSNVSKSVLNYATIIIEAVQQISAAKEYYKADKCAVATNRYFTKAAKTLAKANNVDLWDREFFFGIPKTV